ncbi:MAG: helix-turn-helix transcriptional regulator [Opitutaceae bacterium]|jgi:transcriptional regulator with XRE-family HTH domain
MNQTLAKHSLVEAFKTSMKKQGLSTATLARKVGTSRSAISRVLDPKNTSITLRTAQRTADALGLHITVIASPLAPAELGKLASKLSKTESPAEAARLKAAIISGFYGHQHA